MTKPHIKNMKCFNQVASVIGQSRAQIELWKVVHSDCDFRDVHLGDAFYWRSTPQGYVFWRDVTRGINPYLESKQDE